MELVGENGWTVDASDPLVPQATKKGERSRPLNAAIKAGIIVARYPSDRTVPIRSA